MISAARSRTGGGLGGTAGLGGPFGALGGQAHPGQILQQLNVGESVYVLYPQAQEAALAPWTGFGVFCAYAAAALAGFILITRRDA